MSNVWIHGESQSLIRADSIVLIENGPAGLIAECITGHGVLLATSRSSTAERFGLLEEIRHAQAEERRTVVIMISTNDHGHITWHREAADTLIDQLNGRSSLSGPSETP